MIDLVARGFKNEAIVLFDSFESRQLDLIILLSINLLLRAGPLVTATRDVLKLVVHDFLARFYPAQ